MKEIPLTQGKVVLVDDEDFGRLSKHRWHAWRGRGFIWYAVRNGQRVAGKRSKVRMHREVLCCSGGMEVDHRNGNGLDNQKGNLRVATDTQNAQNRRKISRRAGKPPASPYKGVRSRAASKWEARIIVEGKALSLGRFSSEEDAARAYDAKARELFGKFAKLNMEGTP
jgi:hypothetical protein